MATGYLFPSDTPGPVQMDAELLLDANEGDFDRAIAQTLGFQKQDPDLNDRGHWWLVELRLKSMRRVMQPDHEDRNTCGASDDLRSGYSS